MKDKKAESREFFDRVAQHYDGHRYAGQARWIHDHIVACLPAFNSALDVGCGTGTLLSRLNRPAARLAGADLSPKMIEEAGKKLGANADLRVADAENLPWVSGTFDLVVSALSFHHYPNPVRALSEMRRVLRSGGTLILGDGWIPFPLLQALNWLLKFGKEGDVRIYSKSELLEMAREAGFVDIQSRIRLPFQFLFAKADRSD
jgi:ubiquinone/menaquinone biosynthesis C-methylase UbiE